MQAAFVHLHVHTEYSLANGTVRIKPLVNSVAAAGMPAVAVTDQCNMFSMVKFYRAAMSAGVKPLVGVDVWVADSDEGDPPARLVMLCRNRTGYLNLTRLVSRAYTEGQQRGIPVLRRDWLDGNTDGLIALSGGRAGDVGQALLANRPAQAAQLLEDWQRLFPAAYYLELQRTGRAGEEDYIHRAVLMIRSPAAESRMMSPSAETKDGSLRSLES